MLVKNDIETIRSYFEDASNLKGGYASEVVFPESEADVIEIITIANADKVPVTISGGGTGTTGSRIPFGGIALSTEKLDRIIGVSAGTMTGSAEAGVLVEDFKNACESKDLFYACHPTEKTASLGGTLATNASGSRSFKYGPTRKSVRRLKMVLANGVPLEVRRGDRILTRSDSSIRLSSGLVIEVPLPNYRIPDTKNSAGYYAKDGMDLIDLFIGQEGTLSVITEAEFGLMPMPEKIFSCFVFFAKVEDSWAFAGEVRRNKELDALSVEYFGKDAVDLLRLKSANVPKKAEGAIFFEYETGLKNEDAQASRWLDAISRHGAMAEDTWVAMTRKEADAFTELRHYLPEAVNEMVRKSGFCKLSTDIAVPEEAFERMMRLYTDTFEAGGICHVEFGHIGECHVHTNLIPASEAEMEKAREMIAMLIKEGVSLGGTCSAEHGVGKTKLKYLEIMYGLEGVLEMARIKKTFDPNCILGLGNIFPKEILSRV